ncbi:hypothetical protein IWW51_005055 [Coemansia sp. RSA 2702]|nr:hypothetical protein IWW52_005886 [Coemansia sp. RSA 2704]KAJ2318644.1 hypothetical protein IWW51_005055 [Coemansia sp. RSA 2702]KAJ2359733.1 hypothetical protein H4S01_006034 [Coemansia sp. RSA 2610]
MFRSALARITSARPLALQPFGRRWHQVGPNSARPGMVLDLKGEPQIVVSKDHGGTGRGQAVIKITLKHAVTGAKSVERFRNSDSLEVMLMVQNKYQYLYADGGTAYLMNMNTFEELSMNMSTFEGGKEKLAFLEDGMEVTVQSLEPEPGPISWRLPARHQFKVKTVEDRVAKEKGATYLPATLENGARVQVPDFVKPGDSIIVNLEDIAYVSRA